MTRRTGLALAIWIVQQRWHIAGCLQLINGTH